MNLATTLLYAYGTREGVQKEWDTRGRGRNPVYHGTSQKNAAEIRKSGMWPGKSRNSYATPDKSAAIYYGLGHALNAAMKNGVSPEQNPEKVPDISVIRVDDPEKAGMKLAPKIGLSQGEFDAYTTNNFVAPRHISAIEYYRYQDLLPFLKKRQSEGAAWHGIKNAGGIRKLKPYKTE